MLKVNKKSEPEEFTKYKSKNKKANYTIDLLNLNDNRLCDIRKTFIIKYMSSVEVREYLQEFPSLRRYLELLQN